MPRYNGTKTTPRSKRRRAWLNRRGLINRENSCHERTKMYDGYYHGKTGMHNQHRRAEG